MKFCPKIVLPFLFTKCNWWGKYMHWNSVFRTLEVTQGSIRQKPTSCIKYLLCAMLRKVILWKLFFFFFPQIFSTMFECKIGVWGKGFLQMLLLLEREQWFYGFATVINTPTGKLSTPRKQDLESKTGIPSWEGNLGRRNEKALIPGIFLLTGKVGMALFHLWEKSKWWIVLWGGCDHNENFQFPKQNT